jgi:hypothetical protein
MLRQSLQRLQIRGCHDFPNVMAAPKLLLWSVSNFSREMLRRAREDLEEDVRDHLHRSPGPGSNLLGATDLPVTEVTASGGHAAFDGRMVRAAVGGFTRSRS